VVASDVCVCGGVQSLHLDEEVMTMAEEVNLKLKTHTRERTQHRTRGTQTQATLLALKARGDSRETSRLNSRLIYLEDCSTSYSATPITHSERTRAAVIEQGSLEAGLLGGGAVTGSLLDGSTICYAL
jgi:hypothetical protein